MNNTLKDELQNIINGNEYDGQTSLIQTIQRFLRRNETASKDLKSQESVKSQEEKRLIGYIEENNLWFEENINPENYLTEGAKQKIYRYDNHNVIKLNSCVFYEKWYDYFNSLLIHNHLFSATKYELLGFKLVEGNLHSVVKQEFIQTDEITDTQQVKRFLEYNNFKNVRHNDYISSELGLILEDLHDENVLTKNSVLYFIDTVFYLTKDF
ncbi:putative polyvalent protein kinase domain-containing protein [Capnocytophaga canimorsus]|uniref:putative polyvalent protein kinase domain-containing protein n=1 Tax=Capnocytophaga canimorsus TaxID=28188 RepID=UPI0037D1DA64